MSRVRLTQEESDRLVNRLKNTNLAKFHTLCKMHLSFLLHLPGSSLEEFLGDTGGTLPANSTTQSSKLHFRHLGKKKINKDTKAVSPDVMEQVRPLVEYLSREENLTSEGLFRKTGHVGRQKLLCNKLSSGEDVRVELENGVYSAHDCASVLKVLLSELPEPVLTEKHYLAHCQIPEMEQMPKQLQTLQLLLQLLPAENLNLLQAVLTLLHKVTLEPSNKMTSENLGTVFGPHLLMPRKMSPAELQAVAAELTKTVAFMIENTPELFKLPRPLIRDIATYWAQMEESLEADSQPTSVSDLDLASVTSGVRSGSKSKLPPSSVSEKVGGSDVAITTSVTFADRQASQRAAQKTDTQVELAQLYAHVSSMPESAKKQRLLLKFNKANQVQMSGATPVLLHDKHKRTKSFGGSLKKIVSRNHRRQGSAHKLQIHTVDEPSPYPVSLSKYSARLNEHTPGMIHSCSISRCNSPSPTRCGDTSAPLTPRTRLFDECDLPNEPSPRVHIVDMIMKENTAPLMTVTSTHRRKRKSSPSSSSRKPDVCSPAVIALPPVMVTPSFHSRSHTPDPELRGKWYGQSASSRSQRRDPQRPPRTPLPPQSGLHKPLPPKPKVTSSSHPANLSTPVRVTPDSRFQRSTTFVSPITRKINKAATAIQTNVMTPGSRAPLALLRTP